MAFNRILHEVGALDRSMIILADLFLPGINHAGTALPDAYGDFNPEDGTPDTGDGYSLGLTLHRDGVGQYRAVLDSAPAAILDCHINVSIDPTRSPAVLSSLVAPMGGDDGKTVRFRLHNYLNEGVDLAYNEQLSITVVVKNSGRPGG